MTLSDSQEVYKFIHDELRPDEEFNRRFNDAIDSLYRELQSGLHNKDYGIHNLIKVSGETLLPPTHTHTHTHIHTPQMGWRVVEKDAGVIDSL